MESHFGGKEGGVQVKQSIKNNVTKAERNIVVRSNT